MAKIVLGWVAMDHEGKIVRPNRPGYGGIMKSPPRIYSSAKRAASQSPIGHSVEVFAEEANG